MAIPPEGFEAPRVIEAVLVSPTVSAFQDQSSVSAFASPPTVSAFASPRYAVERRVASAPSAPTSDVRCVAQAIYHEARGEPLRGQRAVADVVMNRVRSGRWSNTACGVLSAPHQFQNFAHWSPPRIGDPLWDRAMDIARDAVSGVVSVSSRFLSFRAVRIGSGGAIATRIGGHLFF